MATNNPYTDISNTYSGKSNTSSKNQQERQLDSQIKSLTKNLKSLNNAFDEASKLSSKNLNSLSRNKTVTSYIKEKSSKPMAQYSMKSIEKEIAQLQAATSNGSKQLRDSIDKLNATSKKVADNFESSLKQSHNFFAKQNKKFQEWAKSIDKLALASSVLGNGTYYAAKGAKKVLTAPARAISAPIKAGSRYIEDNTSNMWGDNSQKSKQSTASAMKMALGGGIYGQIINDFGSDVFGKVFKKKNKDFESRSWGWSKEQTTSIYKSMGEKLGTAFKKVRGGNALSIAPSDEFVDQFDSLEDTINTAIGTNSKKKGKSTSLLDALQEENDVRYMELTGGKYGSPTTNKGKKVKRALDSGKPVGITKILSDSFINQQRSLLQKSTDMFLGGFGLKKVISYAIPGFGSGYRSELPSTKIGIFPAMLKTLGLIYVSSRFSAEENTHLLMQIGEFIRAGFGIQGRMKPPRGRSLAVIIGNAIQSKANSYLKQQGVDLNKYVDELHKFIETEEKKDDVKKNSNPQLDKIISILSYIANPVGKPSFDSAKRDPKMILKSGTAYIHSGEFIASAKSLKNTISESVRSAMQGGPQQQSDKSPKKGFFSRAAEGVGNFLGGMSMFRKIAEWFKSLKIGLIGETVDGKKITGGVLGDIRNSIHKLNESFAGKTIGDALKDSIEKVSSSVTQFLMGNAEKGTWRAIFQKAMPEWVRSGLNEFQSTIKDSVLMPVINTIKAITNNFKAATVEYKNFIDSYGGRKSVGKLKGGLKAAKTGLVGFGGDISGDIMDLLAIRNNPTGMAKVQATRKAKRELAKKYFNSDIANAYQMYQEVSWDLFKLPYATAGTILKSAKSGEYGKGKKRVHQLGKDIKTSASKFGADINFQQAKDEFKSNLSSHGGIGGYTIHVSKDTASKLFHGIGSDINNLKSAGKEGYGKAKNIIGTSSFDVGGPVHGTGNAILHDGEYVLNKSNVDKIIDYNRQQTELLEEIRNIIAGSSIPEGSSKSPGKPKKFGLFGTLWRLPFAMTGSMYRILFGSKSSRTGEKSYGLVNGIIHGFSNALFGSRTDKTERRGGLVSALGSAIASVVRGGSTLAFGRKDSKTGRRRGGALGGLFNMGTDALSMAGKLPGMAMRGAGRAISAITYPFRAMFGIASGIKNGFLKGKNFIKNKLKNTFQGEVVGIGANGQEIRSKYGWKATYLLLKTIKDEQYEIGYKTFLLHKAHYLGKPEVVNKIKIKTKDRSNNMSIGGFFSKLFNKKKKGGLSGAAESFSDSIISGVGQGIGQGTLGTIFGSMISKTGGFIWTAIKSAGKFAMNPMVWGAAALAYGVYNLFSDVTSGYQSEGLWGAIKGIFKTSESGMFGTLGTMSKYAALGFAAGSVFPVVGNVTGALVGAAIGAIVQLFSSFDYDAIGGFIHKYIAGGWIVDSMWDKGSYANSLGHTGSNIVPYIGGLVGGLIGSTIDSITGIFKLFKSDDFANKSFFGKIKSVGKLFARMVLSTIPFGGWLADKLFGDDKSTNTNQPTQQSTPLASSHSESGVKGSLGKVSYSKGGPIDKLFNFNVLKPDHKESTKGSLRELISSVGDSGNGIMQGTGMIQAHAGEYVFTRHEASVMLKLLGILSTNAIEINESFDWLNSFLFKWHESEVSSQVSKSNSPSPKLAPSHSSSGYSSFSSQSNVHTSNLTPSKKFYNKGIQANLDNYVAQYGVSPSSATAGKSGVGSSATYISPLEASHPMVAGYKFGAQTAKMEAGGNPGMVSNGSKWGDPGGTSYGKYQFASKFNIPQKFINSPESGKYGKILKTAGPVNSPGFIAAWKKLGNDPGFEAAQDAYGKKMYLDSHMKKAPWLKSSSPMVQEAVMHAYMGSSNQGNFIVNSINSAGGDKLSDKQKLQLIQQVYNQNIGKTKGFWKGQNRDSTFINKYNKQQQVLLAAQSKYDAAKSTGAITPESTDQASASTQSSAPDKGYLTESEGMSKNGSFTPNLSGIIGYSGKSLTGVNGGFKSNFEKAAAEYFQTTGKKVQVNSAFRSIESQQKLYAAYKSGDGAKAAKPGGSMHNFGYAIDINSADANKMDSLGLFKKYGLHRPVSGEAWHVEPVGIDRAAIRSGKKVEVAEKGVKNNTGQIPSDVTNVADNAGTSPQDVTSGGQSNSKSQLSEINQSYTNKDKLAQDSIDTKVGMMTAANAETSAGLKNLNDTQQKGIDVSVNNATMVSSATKNSASQVASAVGANNPQNTQLDTMASQLFFANFGA